MPHTLIYPLPPNLDRTRDARWLAKSISTRTLRDADVTAVAQWANEDASRATFGPEWCAFTIERGWHPRWAQAVASRYHEILAAAAPTDTEAARQGAISMWQAELRRLRSLPPKDQSKVAGAVAEALRQLQRLIGAEKPVVSVSLSLTGDVSDLSRLSDDAIRAKLAQIEAVSTTEDEATTTGEGEAAGDGPLGGGSPLGPIGPESQDGSLPPPLSQ